MEKVLEDGLDKIADRIEDDLTRAVSGVCSELSAINTMLERIANALEHSNSYTEVRDEDMFEALQEIGTALKKRKKNEDDS